MSKQEVFAGVDLGGTYIKSGLVTVEGEIVTNKVTSSEAEGGVDHVLNRIAEAVHELVESTGGKYRILGVGIGVPGQVDVVRGCFRETPNLPGWEEVRVESEMRRRLDFAVFVDNDANLAALGEFAYGAGSGVTEMLMVTLGTGVGGGLILRGEIYRGAVGAAGEFGHMILHPDGPICACGRRGCVEAYVGSRGILRNVQERLNMGQESLLSRIDPDKMTPKDINDAAMQGDELAIEVFREAGEYLGIGLGNVANLLNIQKAVVGGGVANAGEFILGPARKTLSKTALVASRDTIEVVPAILGERAGLVGGARLAMTECNFSE